MTSIKFQSYAKVNYTLDVLSKLSDGYHGVASVMQVVSLADTITITCRGKQGICLTCDDPSVPADETNLAYRAAESILNEAGVGIGLSILLEKRIPSQAGLGGGSSNAAYTLRAVNSLIGDRVPPERMRTLAANLGSDVPFFLAGGTAAVRGRGEALTHLPDSPPLWFVIVKPERNISTEWAYSELDALLCRVSARATRRMEESLAKDDAERVIARMTNDFEAAIFPKYPDIATIHDEFLMSRALNSRLCGSGSAMFGVTADEQSASEVARIMRLKYPVVFICRTMARQESLALEFDH